MIKYPTREVLESGGIVDGEAFELMLKEESQSEVIRELKEINQHLMNIKILMGYKDKLYCDSNIIDENKKEYKQNSNDIDIELCLESIKSNKTLFNAEIFLDRILNVELCKMLNMLYLDCKTECGYFNKEIFIKMSENLYKKISTYYEDLVDIYKPSFSFSNLVHSALRSSSVIPVPSSSSLFIAISNIFEFDIASKY